MKKTHATHSIGLVALVALVLFVAASPASAQVDSSLAVPGQCYGTLGNTGPNAGSLITIAPSGAGTLVGPTGIKGEFGDLGVPALAIKTTGEMYAMDISSESTLYEINAFDGSAVAVATTNLPFPPAIAFDGNDNLFAVDETGALYVVNDTTGVTRLLGPSGVFVKGLAFDTTTNVLWASDSSGNIYTLDLWSGAATLVGNTGLPASPDIHFDSAGNLFGSSGGGIAANNLISIDQTTGAGTVVGSIGFPSVSGLAARLDRIVPAALQSLKSRWTGRHVEITWQLVGIEGVIDFGVVRAKAAGAFAPLDGAVVTAQSDAFVMVDASTEAGETYRYRVRVLEDGEIATSFETTVTTPALYAELGQNHPNPFNPTTEIPFTVDDAGHVSLSIYDVSGRLVRTLVSGRVAPGRYLESWDGRDATGSAVASGVYFYRLQAGNQAFARKAILLK